MGAAMTFCLCPNVDVDENREQQSMEKFKLYTIDDSLDDSSLPQLITARVRPSNESIKCPFTGNNCLHYHIVAEELVTTFNVADQTEKKKWVVRFQESNAVDFYLADPQSPETMIFVPGKDTNIRRHVAIDSLGGFAKEASAANFVQPEIPAEVQTESEHQAVVPTGAIPKGIEAMALRNKFNLYHPSPIFTFIKRVKREMRYAVFSFDINEQVAMLGIIKEGFGPNGEKVKMLYPISKDTLSSEYFKQYNWSDRDRLSWAALTMGPPCILITKDPMFFQGHFIDDTNYTPPRKNTLS